MPEQEYVSASEVKGFLQREQLRRAHPKEQQHLKLRQVEVFLEAAQYGNFGAASRSLGVSSAYVSESISDLERNLGDVRLFDRDQNGARLTDAGKLLVEKGERLLNAEAEILSAVEGLGSAASSTQEPHAPEKTTRFMSRLGEVRTLHTNNAKDVHAAIVFIEQHAPPGIEVRFPAPLVAELKKQLATLAPMGETVDQVAKIVDMLQVSITDENGWSALANTTAGKFSMRAKS